MVDESMRDPTARNLPEAVQNQLKNLPKKPGCYIYKDEAANVLYVGKAINLSNRVRSYFVASARHSTRIERLVRKVQDIELMIVDSELEALVLECNLIKKYRPPYNVRLRDDKSYPYICVTKEKFPRVMFSRNPRKSFGKYFGPYTSAWSVRETVDELHKTFRLIPCGKSWSGKNEQRPCLYYHMNRCMAPCAGLAEPKEYADEIKAVEKFLSGHSEDLVVDLTNKMAAASDREDFEVAIELRNRISSINAIQEKQKVLSTDGKDRDVIAVVKDDRGSAIQMLYVRGGKLIGQRNFILDGSSESAPGEAVQEFVKQYYLQAHDVPKEILLPVEIEEHHIVQQWLRTNRQKSVNIEVPGGGEKLKLLEMAASNAEQALKTFREELETKEAWANEALEQLAEVLQLPNLPKRIEGYDISNIQGTLPVGSMVVCEDAVATKEEYRRFKVRFHPESPNDFAMMHEVITRRLRAYLDGNPKFTKLPDLIMIDGGKGQLGAALQARDELGLSIPMVGLAKKMELLIIPKGSPQPRLKADREYSFESVEKVYDYAELELPITSHGLVVLMRLRDEAHRFALSFHRKLRDKRMVGTALEEIPGVGPRRRRMLLRTFGSVAAIRRATVEEIAAVPTMTNAIAKTILDCLNEV